MSFFTSVFSNFVCCEAFPTMASSIIPCKRFFALFLFLLALATTSIVYDYRNFTFKVMPVGLCVKEVAQNDVQEDRIAVPTLATFERQNDDNNTLVEYGDSIYLQGDWDGAPIVLEEFKLVFFTSAKVGCTVWKQLFRRMMGHRDWDIEELEKLLPWNPEINGLKYLYDFDRELASKMMTSPEWTRAIFVRDPKERFLSAYLDKAVSHKTYLREKCCDYSGNCVNSAKASPEGFLNVARFCDDAHWRPQSRRMQDKYWSYVNFVGHMENVAEDSKQLLRKIGAWDAYGKTGWGKDGKETVFQAKAGGAGRHHATDARNKLRSYLTPELEQRIEEFYADDFLHPILNLTLTHVF